MAVALLHHLDDHLVVVAAADLHGLARRLGELLHRPLEDRGDVEVADVAEAVEVELRAEEDGAARLVAHQRLLLDQGLDDLVDRRARRADRPGDVVGRRRRAARGEEIQDLEHAVDAADAAAARLGLHALRLYSAIS